MTSIFEEYDTLAGSGLFDAEFYRAAYSDVAESLGDPLVHYLEKGAIEGRIPHPKFDVAYYLEQCARGGERPANPLLHYIRTGAARGYKTHRDVPEERQPKEVTPQPQPHAIAATADMRLFIDFPRIIDGVAIVPLRGHLVLQGWALARSGVAEINGFIDGVRAASAQHGLKRVDVQQAFPDWPEALHSGFRVLIPHRALPQSEHEVTVKVVDQRGSAAATRFRLQILESSEGQGPWALRRKMPQSEVVFYEALLEDLDWFPEFVVFVFLVGEGDAFDHLRRTLRTLREQTYARWRAFVVPAHDGFVRQEVRDALAEFPEISDKLSVVADPASRRFAELARADMPRSSIGSCAGKRSWLTVVQAGDQLGCDALLRLAIDSGLDQAADLLYSDERRWNAAERRVDTFFKPGWSPDLLLSKNYFGRLWCATAGVWEQAGVALADAVKHGEYDVALRCAEAARRIRHVPLVLCQRGPDHIDNDATERKALTRALARRAIRGSVMPGHVEGTFRVKRPIAQASKVSIIIATCAARGLIRPCIESIRKLTKYTNYEIICIENIPQAQLHEKSWICSHADLVLSATENFNWSEFNNTAAAQARGDYFVFLNDDTEIIEPGWLECLVEQVQRPEVGVVGPLLIYPDATIQHAGLFLSDVVGTARHAFRFDREDDVGYLGLALTQRNVIAVTGACLCTRREIFERLGGFDGRHSIVNNDVDYCLRLWEQGLWTVYTPHTRLVHHEMASRSDLGEVYDAEAFGERWGAVFREGDPFLNRNLSREMEHPTPDGEPVEAVFCGQPQIPRDSIRRILVTKVDHIGDCVTALPAVRRLKNCFPDAHFDVLAAPWSREIWALEPAIEEVIEFDVFHLQSAEGRREFAEADLVALAKRLAPYQFDLAIDLRKSPDTRTILQRAGARWLAGFDHKGQFPWLDVALEWEEDQGLRRKRRHVADDLIALVDAVAAACAQDKSVIGGPRRVTLSQATFPDLLQTKPVVCVHPGAGTIMRQWPMQHFATLIDLLLERYDVHVALIGSESDHVVALGIHRRIRNRSAVFQLTGLLTLIALPEFLKGCALFVGNNSGPQHLAAEVGVATVAIHSGVVDPAEWGPRGLTAIALRRNMSCSPCYLENPEECPRALECLTGLLPMRVAQTCGMFLTRFRKQEYEAGAHVQ